MHLLYLLLLFLPPLLWLLSSPQTPGSLQRRLLAGALLSLTGGCLLLHQAPLWTEEGRRLAWRSYSVAGPHAMLGGSGEDAVVAWPSGETLPRLSIAETPSSEGKKAVVEVAGGGGFMAVETGQGKEATPTFFTGQEVPLNGSSLVWDGYKIQVREVTWPFWHFRRWLEAKKVNVRILDALDREVVSYDESRPAGKNPRVLPLSEGLEMKASGREQVNALGIPEMLAVRDWMHGRLMLLPATGPPRLSSLADPPSTLPMPALLQPGQSLRLVLHGLGRRREPVTLRREGSAGDPRWRFSFQAPFKMSSPLPPDPSALVISGRPVPGDQAFALPVGPTGRLLWARLPMRKGADGHWSFHSRQTTGEDPLPERHRPKNQPVQEESVEDRHEVTVSDKISVEVAVVNDFPTQQGLLLPALLAFASLVLTVLCTFRDDDMAETRQSWRAVGGLTLVLWSLLLLRLALALRYALDPGRVDKLAVQTVAECWLALIWAPCVLAHCTRLMRPSVAGASTLTLLWLGTGLLMAAQWHLVSSQWPNFECDFPWKKLILVPILLLVMRGLAKPMLGNLGSFWSTLHEGPGTTFLGFLVYGFIVTSLGFVFIHYGPLSEPLQEIIGPGLLWWFVAWLWLSSQAVKEEEEEEPAEEQTLIQKVWGWIKALFIAVFYGVAPLACVVWGFRDFGTVVAGACLFLTLGIMLVVSAGLTGRPLKHGVALLAALALAGGTALHLMKYERVKGWVGEAAVRLDSWRKGENQEWDYLFSDALPAGGEAESRGVASFKVLNSVQHRWENRAITHAAGWTGQGLGTAPARRSQIPAHTLQADSVFTFYILGDYGLAGGGLLLGVMILPLLFILRSSAEDFDLGHGLAVLVGSALALESVLHAMMNLGFLPFTGRNFPLLAAISNTDLLRWTFLLGLAAMSIMRRHNPDLPTEDEQPSLSPPKSDGWTRWVGGKLLHSVAALLIPLILIAACLWRTHHEVLFAAEYGGRRYWSSFKKNIEDMQQRHYLWLDENLHLHLDDELVNFSDRQVIRQEIARFNALSREEKLLEPSLQSLPPEVRLVENPATYLNLMEELRAQSSRPRRRPCLFAAMEADTAPVEDGDGQEEPEVSAYKVILHPAFESGISFDPVPKRGQMPEVRWADRTTPLIGPAWVNGVWRSATQKDSPLPWVSPLAAALEREWREDGRHLGPEAAQARYGRLTLDLKWQKALQDFTAEKGRALHASLIKDLDPAGPRVPEHHLVRRLPPRVAITLMDVQDGQVLGLGSWPRMTSEAFWTRSEDGLEWLPPSSWLDRQAPRSLRLRYGQEQNFSRFVMGSTTKPLFAAAALELHPFLNNTFVTRTKTQEQSSVFGIPISGRTWQTYEADGQWYNFSKYLTQSVNHYHVALGFLCLAEGDGHQIIAAPGTSKSEDESFSQKPWGKIPFFESVIGYSADKPEVMGNLHQTRFAAVLRKHFPLATTDGQLLSTAPSFWTGDEAHDRPEGMSASGEFARALADWSPAQAHLALDSSPRISPRSDTVNTPRKFVSLLLGGGSNMWSNIQFSSAFATAITGRPLVAHITSGVTGRSVRTPLTASRGENTAFALRLGLSGVIHKAEGTAAGHLDAGKALINQLDQAGIKAYGKTGTLAAQDNQRASSRFIIAFIEWENETQGTVKRGLVLSAYGEKAGMSTTAKWLGEFIARHQIQIFEHFGKVPRAVPVGK